MTEVREPTEAPALNDPPRSTEAVLARYAAELTRHQHTLALVEGRRTRALQALAVAAAIAVWAATRSPVLLFPLLAAVVASFAMVVYLLRIGSRITRGHRLLGLYERNSERAQGKNVQSGRTGLEPGQELRTAGHLFERDLDLLGPDSLFGLLCTVRTGPGERGLARYLLEPATHAEALARQAAVQELVPQLELRENIALLGVTRFQQIAGNAFHAWLAETLPTFPGWVRPVLAVTALVATGLLLTGIAHIAPWSSVLPNLLIDLALQGILCAWLRPRVVPMLKSGAALEQHVKLMAAGLALLQQSQFRSARLQQLAERASMPAGAVETLGRLSRQLEIVEQRPKEYFLLFSLLFAAGTQAAISIAKWKRQYARAMELWVDAWGEFEALNALATYAFEHPEDAWPDLLPEGPARLEAENLGHPLLQSAVRNDVALGDRQRFYLISGSNMAGKSTLLRSIGINVVLASAGAPVRAGAMRLTPLHLGAALALTDSLAEGKSKFKAEVERLANIVALARTAPVLFLVDEIFSGTNSHDREMAAGAVLHALLASGAIGALSTHDLALTELASPATAGTNVHMASPDEDDPLAFDYKLKPGVNRSSNALAIIRMMGLEPGSAIATPEMPIELSS